MSTTKEVLGIIISGISLFIFIVSLAIVLTYVLTNEQCKAKEQVDGSARVYTFSAGCLMVKENK